MKLDRRLLRQARPAWAALGATVGLGLLASVLTVGQAWLLSRAIGHVFLGGRTLPDEALPLALLAALAVVRAGLVWGAEVAGSRVAGLVKGHLREQLLGRVMALGPAYVRGERSGELVNTVVEGVEQLDAYFRHYLPQLALAALVPLTILALVFPLDWVSGLVLLLTAPLLPVFMALIGSLADGLTRRQWTSLSRMSAHFLDILQGLTTLKLLGRSREQAGAIAAVSDEFRQATMGVLRVAFLSALVLEMVATISTAVVAVQVGLRLLYGRLAFEQALFVLILAPEFYLPLRLLGTRFHAGMAGVAAAQRIYQVLGTRAGGRLPAVHISAGDLAARPIDLRDLHLAYDEGRRPALNGLSMSLAPGEKVALVGPSGGGKTSVAHILLRFVEPDRGQATVGGVDLFSVSPAAWRQQVAWVPQDPTLFYGSVAHNIALARPDASREEVVWAARQAHAHAFIETLPQGYDTLVGERGARLSGGEAQRIALARAFLKDAPLIILDEATANLDPETEDQIQEAMGRLFSGRTVLILAHRLGTVVRADRILVVQAGQVVEQGSHSELLARGGAYQRLVASYAGSGLQVAGEDALPDEPAPPRALEPAGREVLPAVGDGGAAQIPRSRTLPRLMRLTFPFAGRLALSIGLGTATVASSMGLMATAATIIARAALHPSIADLQLAIVGVRFFGIARGALRYLERVVSHEVTFRLLARVRVGFYRALEPLAPARLLHYRGGDLLARIVADVETLQEFTLRAVAPPAVALLAGMLACLLVGSFSLRLAAWLAGFLLAAGVGVPALAWVLGRAPSRRLVGVRAELNSRLVDAVQGCADLLAFGHESRTLAAVRRQDRDLAAVQARLAWLGGLYTGATGLLMNLATLAVVAAAIPLVRTGRLDGVYLALLALATAASFEAVLPLAPALQNLESSLAAGRRLFDIVDATPEVTDPPSPLPAPLAAGCDLEVQDLHVRYAAGAAPALSGITFAVRPGEMVAVVGPSGAGKSTLLNVLLRFWEFQHGEVRAGGRSLRLVAQDDWRRLFAVVSQHTHLFNATVRENLLLARPGASDEDLVRAARQAQLHDFVQSLPDGYDTQIGEQGLRLSGGQRQRLAIARAVLSDAPILILDEPTANLDALTESEVLASLRQVMASRVSLVVSHRLAGMEAADEILVLRAGCVVERGRHADLLRRGGLYRRMWELQTQGLA